jgi:hypothetical protein
VQTDKQYKPSGSGRPKRDPSMLTEAQLRWIERKRKYDENRYRKLSKRPKWGSEGHKVHAAEGGLKRRKGDGHAALTRLIKVYEWNAKVKKLPFELSRELFRALVASPCHYCGAPPSSKIPAGDIWSGLTYNGVDRYDNSKGYTEENSVACCKICNRAKRDLPIEEFLKWIKSICSHQQEKHCADPS